VEDFKSRRSKNLADGRLLNHGMPITRVELDLVADKFRQGCDLASLENYFQRSKSSILSMLEKIGVEWTPFIEQSTGLTRA
jgi:hypothetical protein